MKGIVMKQDFDEQHYFAGYPGEDSMREKAKRLMLEEMMTTAMNKPSSITAPGREKMRLYKEGGHVKKHHKHYRDEHKHHHKHHHGHHEGGEMHHHGHHHHDGGDVHAYEHEAIHPFHGEEARHHSSYKHGGETHSYERGPGYKHGGKVHHKHHHGHHSHHEHHEHHGHHEHGSKERKRAHLHHLQREGLHKTEHALAKERKLSDGGYLMPRTHPKMGHHPETHQRQTYRQDYAPKNIEGGQLTNLHIPTPKLNVETVREYQHMHKGGHMHKPSHHKKHHHSHHKVKRATGGTVYEHEMRGVHPASHLTKINYEKDMKGVKPVHIPNMAGSSRKNPGAMDESFGSVFHKGGKACRGGHMAKKMAAGGAGKVRKGVADKFGRPNLHKLKMGY
jgi:hypothetical protein